MKTWIYSWIIYPIVFAAAGVVGMFNVKVRETLRLRSWKDFLSLRFNVGQPIDYWVHVASAGELEYAIPILQELGRRGKRVLVTYYSISAKRPVEDLTKTHPNVSLVVPLPHDGLGLMKEFVALVKRQGVHHLLLMKYELWPGLLWECNAQGVKVLLVDALKPGWFHRRLLHKLDAILSGYATEVQSVTHKNVRVVGDTRVERVLQRVQESQKRLDAAVPAPLMQRLKERPVLVCGSMWPVDDKILLPAIAQAKKAGKDFNLVWVPHEMNENECRAVSGTLADLGFHVYNIDETAFEAGKALGIIVMKKGILAELYRLGQAAYVGGGFGSGVHSVWEPALCGVPVACGPRTSRSPESEELRQRNRLTRVSTPEELSQWIQKSLDQCSASGSREKIGVLQELLSVHVGAAQRIVGVCEEE